MLPALALLALLVPQDGKLKELEDAAKRKDPERPRRHDPDPRDDDPWDEFWGELFVNTVGWIVIYPFTDQDRRYEDYPYAGSGSRGISTELKLDYQRVEHDLDGWRGAATLCLPSGCSFVVESTSWTEGRDDLSLTRVELNYGFLLRDSSFEPHLGWGVAVLSGDGSDAAATLQAGVTWLVAEPVSVRLSIAWMGFDGATFNDFDLGVRWHVGRFAVSAGWRAIWITNGPDLDGPTLGAAVFF